MLAIFVIYLELKFIIIIGYVDCVENPFLRRNDSTSFVDEYVNLCVNELHVFVDENCSVVFLHKLLCAMHKRSVMFHHSFHSFCGKEVCTPKRPVFS